MTWGKDRVAYSPNGFDREVVGKDENLNWVAFSSDGRVGVHTKGKDWDPKALVFVIDGKPGGEVPTQSNWAIHLDRRGTIAVSRVSLNATDAVIAIDPTNGKQRWKREVDQALRTGVAVAPSGWAVATTVGSRIEIFDAADGETVLAFSPEEERPKLTFVGDDRLLVVGARARLYDLRDGKQLAENVAVRGDPAASPDGGVIAVMDLHGVLLLLDPDTLETRRAVAIDRNSGTPRVSDDGRYVVSRGGAGHRIVVHDTKVGVTVGEARGHLLRVDAIVKTEADGLVSHGERRTCWWSRRTQDVVPRCTLTPQAVALGPSRTAVAHGSQVLLFDNRGAASGDRVDAVAKLELKDRVRSLATTPGGVVVAHTADSLYASTLHIIDPASATVMRTMEVSDTSGYSKAAATSENTVLLSGPKGQGGLVVRLGGEGDGEKKTRRIEQSFTHAAITRDGATIALGREETSLLDVATGTLTQPEAPSHEVHPIKAMAFDPSGRYLAVAREELLEIFDRGQLLHSIEKAENPLAFREDGMLLHGDAWGDAVLRDPRTGKAKAQFEHRTANRLSVVVPLGEDHVLVGRDRGFERAKLAPIATGE
jgi:hypothetical protein